MFYIDTLFNKLNFSSLEEEKYMAQHGNNANRSDFAALLFGEFLIVLLLWITSNQMSFIPDEALPRAIFVSRPIFEC